MLNCKGHPSVSMGRFLQWQPPPPNRAGLYPEASGEHSD